MNIIDTLQNLVSGMGVFGQDKSQGAHFIFRPITPMELQSAYRGDWIARKIIDIPAYDEVRAWRSWQADKDQITKIEAEEKRLNVRGNLFKARKLARLTGGSCIIMDDGRPLNTPFKVSGVGGLKRLLVVPRTRMKPEEATWLVGDDSERPVIWNWTPRSGAQQVVHPSRVRVFQGAPILDVDGNLSLEDEVYGDSKLQAVMDAVKAAGSAHQGVATLVEEASVDVIRVDQFMSKVGTKEYRDRMMERLSLTAVMKSIHRAMYLDKNDEYERKQISFANLPEVLQTFWQAVSGAADMPQTRFFGTSPQGMNATGESDLANYHASIAAGQSMDLDPILAPMTDALIISALGTRPPEIHYTWNSLDRLSEKDEAEVTYKRAQRDKVYFDMGALPEGVAQKAIQNALIEKGTYPGLEQDIADFEAGLLLPFKELDADGNEVEEPDPADILSQGTGGNVPGDVSDLRTVDGVARIRVPSARVMLDAAAKPLYVSRKLLNADDVVAWAEAQGIGNIVPGDTMHVTVAYSREPVEWMKMGTDWSGDENGRLRVMPGGPREVDRFGKEKDALVLLFAHDGLTWRHQRFIDAGCSWDWPDYQPHLTISWDAGDVDLSKVKPYSGPLVFAEESFAEIVEDWKKTLGEV